jgi:hypothetical protein
MRVNSFYLQGKQPVLRFWIFFKAHQLTSLLDQQEQALGQTAAGYDSPGADRVIRDYDAVGGQYQSFHQSYQWNKSF